jgi:hypothetical protein
MVLSLPESQQFGVIFLEQGSKRCRGAINRCMDLLNQPKGIRGHYQQIAKAPWTGGFHPTRTFFPWAARSR